MIFSLCNDTVFKQKIQKTTKIYIYAFTKILTKVHIKILTINT